MLGIPVTDGLVLAICPFTGSLRDFSGAGRHPAQAGSRLQWTARGGVDQLLARSTGRLVVANDATLEAVTDFSLFVAGIFDNDATIRRIFSKLDVGGHQIDVYTRYTTSLILGDGVNARRCELTDWSGVKSFCINSESGQIADLYTNGSFLNVFDGVTTVTADDADVVLFNLYNGTNPLNKSVSALLLYNRVLTADEISATAAFTDSLITPRRQWPGSGLRYPGRGDPYTHAPGDPTYLDNLQTARVSTGDETSGKLSNTGMDIVTGTWRVSEDATGRYYNCVGNGQIKRRVIGADAMTTRLFTEEGSATLTKTTTEIQIDALATDKIRAVQLEAA